MNINSETYWDDRFGSGDWENRSGRDQTRDFASAIVPKLKMNAAFSGSICDFGCGLGDAIPIFKGAFPNANLYGTDISSKAIAACRSRYGKQAMFIAGDHTVVPQVDVIVASNVFEHLSNDKEIAQFLLKKCSDLYIVVPFREQLVKSGEHVNSYDELYFKDIGHYDYSIFPSRGWSQFGFADLWYDIYFKNLFRPLLGRPIICRAMQIMYHFKSSV